LNYIFTEINPVINDDQAASTNRLSHPLQYRFPLACTEIRLLPEAKIICVADVVECLLNDCEVVDATLRLFNDKVFALKGD